MDSSRIKQRLRRAVSGVAPRATGGIRVLLYHAVDDPVPGDRLALRVPRGRFLEQMQLLRDEGYRVVPLAAVGEPQRTGDERCVAITFDDGYRSHAWAAATLHAFGFPATFFLVPRFLDGVTAPAVYWETWGHLGWDDAATLIENGFEVGAHSVTHPDLRTCGDAELDHEVGGARALLEARLGGRIASFSYPYGRHDARVRNAATRAGYQLACTSRYGVNRTSGPSFDVRRTEVAGTDELHDFALKLNGQYDWLGYWQDVRPAS